MKDSGSCVGVGVARDILEEGRVAWEGGWGCGEGAGPGLVGGGWVCSLHSHQGAAFTHRLDGTWLSPPRHWIGVQTGPARLVQGAGLGGWRDQGVGPSEPAREESQLEKAWTNLLGPYQGCRPHPHPRSDAAGLPPPPTRGTDLHP